MRPPDAALQADHRQAGALRRCGARHGQLRPQADGCQHAGQWLDVWTNVESRALTCKDLDCRSTRTVSNQMAGGQGHCGEMKMGRSTPAKLDAASASTDVYVLWHHQLPEHALHG